MYYVLQCSYSIGVVTQFILKSINEYQLVRMWHIIHMLQIHFVIQAHKMYFSVFLQNTNVPPQFLSVKEIVTDV